AIDKVVILMREESHRYIAGRISGKYAAHVEQTVGLTAVRQDQRWLFGGDLPHLRARQPPLGSGTLREGGMTASYAFSGLGSSFDRSAGGRGRTIAPFSLPLYCASSDGSLTFSTTTLPVISPLVALLQPRA